GTGRWNILSVNDAACGVCQPPTHLLLVARVDVFWIANVDGHDVRTTRVVSYGQALGFPHGGRPGLHWCGMGSAIVGQLNDQRTGVLSELSAPLSDERTQEGFVFSALCRV